MTVIVTDAKYRASIAAARSLAKCGHEVVIVQTAKDACGEIPAFKSKYVSRTVLFDCSVNDADVYCSALAKLASEYEYPTVFPIGAATTALLAQKKNELTRVCAFTVSDPATLALANDKSRVRLAAESAGIAVPRTYDVGETPESYPVIVKPRCGEAFGLKARERYAVANDFTEYTSAYEKMSKYGGEPIVQELVAGVGIGVSLLMSRDGRAVSAICHKRVREYPSCGGPSACCESFFDAVLVSKAEKLLASIGFVGIAMVEFKGGRLLEINPRVWGSFPMTYVSGSSFAEDYVKLSSGEPFEHMLDNYKSGCRMNFILSDFAACADLICHKRFTEAFAGLGDIILRRAADGVYDKDDSAPFWSYLHSKFFKNNT